MDSLSNVSNQGQAAIDKAADTVHSGVHPTRDNLSDGVEFIRTERKLSDQASTVAKTIRDTALQTSEAMMSYTRENPAKALLIAAGCGALVLTLVRALLPSRGKPNDNSSA